MRAAMVSIDTAGAETTSTAGGLGDGGCVEVGAVADEVEDVVDGRVVAELELVVAGDGVFLADGGEQFGLFDGVDAEVGFEVEVGGEHLGGVAGLFGDEGDDARRDGVDRHRWRGRRHRRQGASVMVGVSRWVRSRTKSRMWLMVG